MKKVRDEDWKNEGRIICEKSVTLPLKIINLKFKRSRPVRTILGRE